VPLDAQTVLAKKASHWRRESLTMDFSFPRAMRLSGKLAFAGVYDNGVSQTRGPLKAVGIANGLSHVRLGLSVSRRVGTAPQRNRIKRLLREALRQLPQSRSLGYDVVIVVRPHEPLTLAGYQKILGELLSKMRVQLVKREK
jgi:ribonuclease P protein component